MVEIQTVSIVIASAGVFVAVIYYILQVRHQTRLRQTDLVIDFIQLWVAKNWNKMRPIIEAMRKYFGRPQLSKWFECLYNEMSKREQK